MTQNKWTEAPIVTRSTRDYDTLLGFAVDRLAALCALAYGDADDNLGDARRLSDELEGAMHQGITFDALEVPKEYFVEMLTALHARVQDYERRLEEAAREEEGPMTVRAPANYESQLICLADVAPETKRAAPPASEVKPVRRARRLNPDGPMGRMTMFIARITPEAFAV